MIGTGAKIALVLGAAGGGYLAYRRLFALHIEPVVASSVGDVLLMQDPLQMKRGVRYRFRYLEPAIANPRDLFGPHTTLFRAVEDLPRDWPAALGAGSSPDLRWGETLWEEPDASVRRVDGVLQVWRA